MLLFVGLLAETVCGVKDDKVTETTIDNKDNIYDTCDTYNYLAIGNSLTKHEITDFWWNEIGMAASDENHDFYHLVVNELQNKNGEVVSEAVKFKEWEVSAENRSETLQYIEGYLHDGLNLITLQLGENALDITTFEQDYEELIIFVRDNAPNATIIAVGDFWENEDRDDMKQRVAEKTSVVFVDLSEIRENSDYMVGMGSVVYDAEGGEHIIQDYAVAAHPSDIGMKYIADAIIAKLD